ncbi:TetR/AcrR family transcriptional regulator [Leucobacter sp. NPDC058333]|uniref:TetR/AcrR family transcriptional regulator n=1 Tax=Leucobacter sp. NPDC058333 TaxID=3346450 RepID=UPI003647702D
MRLFAERGYESTSVAEIQVAAGMTGGSGALYKHFASKEAVLAEGVRRYIADFAEHSATTVRSLPNDPQAALRAIAEGVMDSMTANEAILRVLLRDLEGHREMLDRVWEGVLAGVYTEMAQWIRAQNADKLLAVVDPEATATVLMSALTYWPILHSLTGKESGGLARSAYIEAWIDTSARALGITEPTRPNHHVREGGLEPPRPKTLEPKSKHGEPD